MSREVLSSQEYQYSQEGYLVDNTPWQDEIRKRLEEQARVRITEPHPTLDTDEFQPLLLPENPEAVAAPAEEVKPPEPTAEEVSQKLKEEAEEKAKSIEQGARKNAFEIVEQARWEANDIVAKAKEEAEKEVQQLKETASETGRKEGYAKGLEEGVVKGLEKGRNEGLQNYSESLKKWNGLLEQTTQERKRLLSEMEPILVELVGDVLHRCLQKEAKRHHQMVLDFAKEAVAKAQDRIHLRLHLNPEDVAEVEAQKEQLQLTVGAADLEVVPDARIERGGCILETEAGTVDSRLSTIVDQAKKALNQGL